jgi:hypothetical protein
MHRGLPQYAVLAIALAGCGSAPIAGGDQALSRCSGSSRFIIGAGKSDITGPFVGSSTGYNNPTDGDPYTQFDWARTGGDLSGTSQATVTWQLRDEAPGTYRVVYNGLGKHSILGALPTYLPFTGVTPTFQVQ